MTAPRLSVVLPVHNGLPYVEASICSILAQSFTRFELVIGDDGSSDGTGAVLRRLADADPRIRLLSRPAKSGLSNAANWLVTASRAPLVAIAHADDVARPQRLEREVALIDSHPDAVLVGAVAEGIDARGRVVQPSTLARLLAASPFAPFAHSTILFRRAAFDQAGGYRPEADYWEDLDLYWRIARLGRILVVPDVLGAYRHSPASARSRDGAERVGGALDRMFRSAARVGAERGDRPPAAAEPGEASRRLHPRAFVGLSWLDIWSGRRPRLLGRMLRRAELRFDRQTLQSAALLAWAEVSPRSLRLFLRSFGRWRNRRARRRLEGVEAVEWNPFARSPPRLVRPTSVRKVGRPS